MKIDTPICIIIFNRPDKTLALFNALQKIKPKQLFIIADGPRKNIEHEENKCAECRNVFSKIDWECSIKTNYANENLGCKKRIVTGLDWVFSEIEKAIILEDDCIPDSSFFLFCDQLLERYKDDKRISLIGGSQPYQDGIEIEESYFYSIFNRIWGWATWRRAWLQNDPNLDKWPKIKKEKLHYSFFQNIQTAKYWEQKWDLCHAGKIDTWDYQWFFSRLTNNTLSIVPKFNLVSNIGFDESATHTKIVDSEKSNAPKYEMEFPLVHPEYTIPNYLKDGYVTKRLAASRIDLLTRKIKKKLKLL